MSQYRVRIKPGNKHGCRRQYGPGDELVVSEDEKEAFGDKFVVLAVVEGAAEPADGEGEDHPEFDLKKASAEAVLAAVEDGIVTAEDALKAEAARKRPRKTVLEALAPEPEGEA